MSLSRKMVKKYYLLFIVYCFVSHHLFGDTGDTKVTIKVIGEDDQPIEGAEAKVTFQRQLAKSITEKGVSDKDGLFSAEGVSEAGHISYSAVKEGYYLTLAKIFISSINNKDPELKNGKWQPWNPIIPIVIKKKINPVPMYVERVNLTFPAVKQKLGFDLEKGDWVAPYGKGIISDFIFFAEYEERGQRDFDFKLTVNFSNPDDGILPFEEPLELGSALKSSQVTPEKGYLSEWIQIRNRRPGEPIKGNYDAKRNYYFRVRSEKDENGKLAQALYGKIYGDFSSFVYYLNPDKTRNVEFDPKKNLFVKNFKDKMNVDYNVTQP